MGGIYLATVGPTVLLKVSHHSPHLVQHRGGMEVRRAFTAPNDFVMCFFVFSLCSILSPPVSFGNSVQLKDRSLKILQLYPPVAAS